VGETWTWTLTHTVLQSEIDSNGGGNGKLENAATARTVTPGLLPTATVTTSVVLDQEPGVDVQKLVSVDDGLNWYVINDEIHTVNGVTMTNVQYLEFLYPSLFNDNNLHAGTPPAELGDTVSYEVVVTNTGNVTLHNVTVTDVPALPSPFVLPSTDLAPGASEISNVVTDTVDQSIISVHNGGGSGGAKSGHVAKPVNPAGLINDMTKAGTLHNDAGAIWANQLTDLESVGASGTGVFNTFSRLQANGSEGGFNTDAQKPALDEKASIHTHSLALSSLATVDANGLPATTGTTYYEFRLDINQSGSAPYLSLNKLQIYQHGAADLNTLAAVQSTALPSDYRAYDLDANGDHTVLLNASLGAGSGSGGGVVDNADLIVLVPTANFNPQAGDFIYLYSEFGTSGGGWVSNGGFEEWGALTPLVTTISDTATVTATAGTGNQTVSDSDTASYRTGLGLGRLRAGQEVLERQSQDYRWRHHQRQLD
jgi:uncharacterized repeat protein (TIGR01451 family)